MSAPVSVAAYTICLPVDEVLFQVREDLTHLQPWKVGNVLSLLAAAAVSLKDDELLTAVHNVTDLESNDPLYMERYSDLLVCAGDAFSFLELLAQVIAAEIERHAAALGIEEKIELEPITLKPGVN